MILVDACAWVEFDWATGSAADERIAALSAEDGPLLVTEPLLTDAWPAPAAKRGNRVCGAFC